MNNTLLDIIIKDGHEKKMWENEEEQYRYIYIGDSIKIFEDLFYPYLEQLNEEKQLQILVERLSSKQKEVLLKIPQDLIYLKTIRILEIDTDREKQVLELKCFERIVKSYKHQLFFELLEYIDIDKKYSLVKENHNFGYHFHLYEKRQRTATLLTFDKDEHPNERNQKCYATYDHTLYFEPHSEGSSNKKFQDINSKNSKFKIKLYSLCSDIVRNDIEKINFKKQSSTKSKKYIRSEIKITTTNKS